MKIESTLYIWSNFEIKMRKVHGEIDALLGDQQSQRRKSLLLSETDWMKNQS
jgi:hypothetical protein